jgi:hypothetical protein
MKLLKPIFVRSVAHGAELEKINAMGLVLRNDLLDSGKLAFDEGKTDSGSPRPR